MELTDSSLILLLGGLGLVVFVLLVIGWPHWGNRYVRAATRGVQVLLLNVLVVAVCGAALNDQYLFYSSWADLLGSRAASVQTHHGGTSHDVLVAKVPGTGLTHLPATPAKLPPLPQPGARLQSYGVVDQRANSQGQVLVYLPVGYNPKSTHAYPVILGLHGFPSGPMGFVRLNMLSTIDTLTAEHKMAPSIVVIPRIDTPAGLDTECVNGGPGQPQTDTWLAHDIPTWTAKHFHVQRVRTSWATWGYSYGAWCAASLSMRHPDVFGASIGMQGYFRPDFSSRYDPLTSATLGGYDLVNLAHTAPPALAMWILTSREDGLSYPTTSKFLSVAKPPLDVTATVLAHGGHRDSVWESFVPASFLWLAQTMPGFHG